MFQIPKNERVTSNPTARFIILNDFFDSFEKMELSPFIDIESLNQNVISPFRLALKENLDNLTQYDLSEIRKITSSKVDERYYRITMDNGTYFNEYDFNFNITRSAYNLNDVKSGPYFRIPRGEGRQIISQGNLLYNKYARHGGGKPIALCDDGVGTGKSLERIINVLEQLKITATKIFVLLNPNHLVSVGNNDVNTLVEIKESYAWLSERDLFWGIPRSGVTCSITFPKNLTKSSKKQIKLGVPYTIDNEMIKNRIADFQEKNNLIRETCIKYNILLWEEIQRQLNRKFKLAEIQRLKSFGELIGREDSNIVDFLKEIKHKEFRFDEIINK